MKLAIFGHSYVTYLSQLGIKEFEFDNKQKFELEYFDYPGATFSKFLHNPSLFNDIENCCPDVIVVILGGNDINLKVKISEIKQNCQLFYEKLRSILPNTIVFASQIELRFYPENNSRKCPTIEIYKTIRNGLNKFLNRLKSKDSIFLLGGENRLDNIDYYKTDGVHLTEQGNQILMKLIRNCIHDNFLNL